MKQVILLTIVYFLFVNHLQSQDCCFIENQGQWDDDVKFLTEYGNIEAWIKDNSLVFNTCKGYFDNLKTIQNLLEFDKFYGIYAECFQKSINEGFQSVLKNQSLTIYFKKNKSKSNFV